MGGKVLVFGGLRGSAEPRPVPLGDLVVLDPATLEVERVVSGGGGPALSHHGSVPLHDRWLLVVGGWDGRRRLSALHAYDLAGAGGWARLEEEEGGGSRAPHAGLSGHTCTKVSDREGGVRTQRRFASLDTLHVDAAARRYWRNPPNPGRSDEPKGNGRGLIERLSSLIASGSASPRTPRALRHHSMTLVGPFAVLDGGECFNKASDTVCNDLFIYDTRTAGGRWYQLSGTDSEMKRVGHRVLVVGENLCLIGGRGPDGTSCSPEIYTLEINT
ncbi:LOW QUALITY PROTEIN: kelch domain-containing protein 9-like [Heptranchias perlo]|uniref:LOW QUALITY PROTEIN: kelch domain-containing protein 9-like n=1 Tax=Heptranchias perlo TaxID=212740 RepID=UPI00355A1B11